VLFTVVFTMYLMYVCMYVCILQQDNTQNIMPEGQ